MPTLSGELVFVPVFGDGVNKGGLQDDQLCHDGMPHVKAWGLLDSNEEFFPLHTEPRLEVIRLREPYNLFDAETAAMQRLADDADVPAEVSIELAKLALVRED